MRSRGGSAWFGTGMRILVTGGAGFIGSHIADALLAARRTTSASSTALAAGRARRAAGLLARRCAELVTGDLRDPQVAERRSTAWTRSATRPRWSAWATTCRDIADYVAPQRPRHRACCCGRMAAAAGAAPRAGLAHGGLRRGPLRLRRARPGRPPGPRALADLDAGPLRAAAARAAARTLCTRAGARGRAAGPAQRLRGDQAGPGAPGRRVGARDRRQPRVALRYHNVYGPRMPRDTPYAGVARHLPLGAGAGRGAAGVRGRRPAARLRPRGATSRAANMAWR